jgi:hypothetical protein
MREKEKIKTIRLTIKFNKNARASNNCQVVLNFLRRGGPNFSSSLHHPQRVILIFRKVEPLQIIEPVCTRRLMIVSSLFVYKYPVVHYYFLLACVVANPLSGQRFLVPIAAQKLPFASLV